MRVVVPVQVLPPGRRLVVGEERHRPGLAAVLPAGVGRQVEGKGCGLGQCLRLLLHWERGHSQLLWREGERQGGVAGERASRERPHCRQRMA